MTSIFSDHPASVGETYAQACDFAFGSGPRMILGGLGAMVHAFFPFLSVTTAGRALDVLNAPRAAGARFLSTPRR